MTGSRPEAAALVEGQSKTPQDRAAVFRRGAVTVGVVADGAGGTSGGAEAATAVIEAVRVAVAETTALLDPFTWKALLVAVGSRLTLRGHGHTTAVIAATDGMVVVGASVGDSVAWLLDAGGVRDLTLGQPRQPLLGGGAVAPHTFSGRFGSGTTLLLATDGLWKYAPLERISEEARRPERTMPERCAALVDLVRLPQGALQDDVGLVVFRAGAEEAT